MKTMKSRLFFGLILSVAIYLISVVYLCLNYEMVVGSYENLTKNISYAENILFRTDEITDNVVNTYSEFNPDVADRVILELEQLAISQEVLRSRLSNDSSLFVYKRLSNALENFKENAYSMILNMRQQNIAFASINRDAVTKTNAVINTITKDLVTSELSHMQLQRLTLENRITRMRLKFSVGFIFAIFIQLLIMLTVNRNLITGMNRLIDLYKEIGKGNLDIEVIHDHAVDEFETLILEADHMRRSLMELRKENELSRSAIVTAIGSVVDMRDNDTGKHINGLQTYLEILCDGANNHSKNRYVLNDDFVSELLQVAPLHDIGKVGIPDYILNKPGKLTADEFEVMKNHVIYGLDVIHQANKIYEGSDNTYFNLAIDVIGDHHEKWDGSGYPLGKRAEQITLAGRLVAIVDVYDALTSDRTYKKAFPHEKAVDIILEGKGKHFDPDLVDVFMKVEKTFEELLIGSPE